MQQSRRIRSLVALSTSTLALYGVVLVAADAPATAAVAPVHIRTVTGQLVVPSNTEQHWKGYCPSGYTPASGGFTNPSLGVWRAYDYATAADDSWEFAFINGDAVSRTIALKILCVLKSEVGTITSTTVAFNRNTTTGLAGGAATCPSGKLLSAGVDWSGGGDRKITQAYPLDLGRFQASGYSAIPGAQLFIEVRCMSASLGAVHDWSSSWTPSSNGVSTPQTIERICPDGMRIMLGGVRQNGQTAGEIYASNPTGRSWTATLVHPATGGYMGVDAICVPGSTPVVTVQQPPWWSNDPGQTLRFTASEPTGESLSYVCTIDSSPVTPCTPDTDLTYSGVTSQGQHTFKVTASNSWTSGSDEKSWSLDSVAPSITATSPLTEGLTTDPVTITFSEQVSGVSTVGIAAAAGGSAVPYTATLAPGAGGSVVATLQPNQELASGQSYTVTVPAGLQDAAGNTVPPMSWSFRAVEHVAPTLSAKTTTLGLSGPVTATFSELVSGLSGSSFYLRPDGSTSNVAATVSTAVVSGTTTATLRPSTRLVPGRWYTAYLTSAIVDHSDNAFAGTSWRLRAPTAIQNDSPAIVERWDLDASARASGGKVIASRMAASTATLTFTATSGQVASLYGLRVPTGGSAEVWLDGVKRTTVSTKATTAARVRLYATPALTAGSHSLRVRVVTGWTNLDSVTVGTTTYQESAFVQTFRRLVTSSASGSSYDLVEHVGDADGRPTYAMSFSGSGIRLYATKNSISGYAYVYVDGTLISKLNLYSATTAYKQLVFSKALAAGSHTIVVACVGTASGSRSSVGLDYLQVV